jgi:hypothetical protein
MKKQNAWKNMMAIEKLMDSMEWDGFQRDLDLSDNELQDFMLHIQMKLAAKVSDHDEQDEPNGPDYTESMRFTNPSFFGSGN